MSKRITTPGSTESFQRIKITGTPWENDHLQFARLLGEMVATIELTQEQVTALSESMDLPVEEIHNLMDRAQNAWDDVVART